MSGYTGMIRVALAAFATVQLYGCIADDGNNGFTALIDTAIENPGVNCADGGLVVHTGLDNGEAGGIRYDGVLQVGERDTTDYICNGAVGPIGPAGFNSLINPVAEAPGANCSSGGVRLDVGLDNGDGGGTANNAILEAGEIDQTSYACDGDAGSNGITTLVDIAVENPGANCTDGGLVVYAGLDNGDGGGIADDGILQAGERDETDYVCNGSDGAAGLAGFNSLINLTDELAGVNCEFGGVKIDVGLDNGDGGGTAGNATLETGEIDQTSYVCDGEIALSGSGTLGVTDLTLSNCSIIDHQPQTLDDRGGVAISSSHFYVGGDGGIARMDKVDLANLGQPSTAIFDGLISDIDSGVLYSLSLDGTTSMGACSAFTTITHLVELDADLAVVGSLPLSQNIPINGCAGNGMYAGPGFMILLTDTNYFKIDFVDGAVTDLGARTPGAINPFGCETWANWGVAEYDGADYAILYRDSSGPTIVRNPVGTTTVTPVVTFAGPNPVSDLCSFTVAPDLNRWYFHYEGGSGVIGGTSETAGFCDASFQ